MVEVSQQQEALIAEQQQAEKMRRAVRAKSARIGRLVRQVEGALSQSPMDAARTGTLLKELERLKGRKHAYVAKLRAYWLVKQGQNKKAAVLLKSVLATKRDDMEAGINLALIEIQLQQYRQAGDRLKRLREVYPDNALIADLLRELK